MKSRAATTGAALLVATLFLSIGEAQALRPTDAAHPQSYGAEASYLDSPQGHVRVWWATEGVHRSPRVAEDGETPEIAQTVAQVGDEVFEAMETYGFRQPLVDSDLYPESADDGGDGRFDIYLIAFEAGDGQFVSEYCTTDSPERCAGYAMLDHAFVPLYYPSREMAVKVVFSHEIFHGVQAAYRADWPVWASEGSASWFEELVYPEQNDFERLTGYYFEDSARSLNDRARGPSDGFAYGAGIFFYFLEQIFGVEGLVAVAERFSTSGTIEDALSAELAETFGEVGEAFELFAIYNLFSGSLELEGGYPEAGRFAGVELVDLPGDGAFNWEQNVDELSARFARWEVDVPMTLTPTEVEGWPAAQLALIRGGSGDDVMAHESVAPGQSVEVGPEDSPVYLVASQGLGDDAVISAQGRILSADEDPAEDAPGADSAGAAEGGCSQSGGGSPGGGVVWALVGLCLMSAFTRAGSR